MSRDIAIAGFGQCGSHIALEIATLFDPRADLSREPHTATSRLVGGLARALLGTHRRGDAARAPEVYLADLNTSNEIYSLYMKSRSIQSQIGAGLPSARMRRGPSIRDLQDHEPELGFTDGDAWLVERIANNPDAASTITPLRFSVGGVPLLDLGGAGGIQALSEALAEQDTTMQSAIVRFADGMFVGVFAVGGGTGAGSLFSVLSRYKESVNRYTVGIGIMPAQTEPNCTANAGRYLCRFLGTPLQHRYHTLFLFSNECADVALTATDGTVYDKGAGAKAAINAYVREFVAAFTMMDDPMSETLIGKSFDPMDGKTYMNGLATVGRAAGDAATLEGPASGEPTVVDLFVDAATPMRLARPRDGGALSGLAVPICSGSAVDDSRVRELVGEILAGVTSGDSLAIAVDDLRALTPYYTTISRVYVLYFVRDRDPGTLRDIVALKSDLAQFFELVAGAPVDVSVSAYANPTVATSVCQLLVFDGASPRVIDHILDYVRVAWFDDSDDAYASFYEDLLPCLSEAYRIATVDAARRTAARIEQVVEDHLTREVEAMRPEVHDVLQQSPIIAGLGYEQVLVTKRQVAATFVSFAGALRRRTGPRRASLDLFGPGNESG